MGCWPALLMKFRRLLASAEATDQLDGVDAATAVTQFVEPLVFAELTCSKKINAAGCVDIADGFLLARGV
jgi:hypothetical protein